MIHLMENKNQGASKKLIKVRKPRPSPDTSITNLNYTEESYIPISSNDSQWNGIEFEIPKAENTEHNNCLSGEENEIKVIELDSTESLPLFLLFPELKHEERNFQNVLDRDISTTEVTKMLVGKKPNLTLLKPCKKLTGITRRLSPVVELSESDESLRPRRTTRQTSPYNLPQRDQVKTDDESDDEDDTIREMFKTRIQ